jgi:predicted alpha/beta hydrolase
VAPDLTASVTHLDRGTDRLAVHTYPGPAADGPAIVIWPAMGTPARFYRRFAADLHAAGFQPIVVDLRGTGASTPPPSRASRYGYAELADDVAAVLTALGPDLGDRKVFLLGHSLGGQLCLLHLALAAAPGVDGLVLVAVGLPHFRQYPPRRAIGVLPFTQWIAATTAVLRVWPGWGFGGRQARRVIADWGYTARHGRFPLLRGRNAEKALAAVTTPVFAVSVDNDQFTPAATTDHLMAKLPKAAVQRWHYAAAGLDHFGWVRAGGPLAVRIADWALTAQR